MYVMILYNIHGDSDKSRLSYRDTDDPDLYILSIDMNEICNWYVDENVYNHVRKYFIDKYGLQFNWLNITLREALPKVESLIREYKIIQLKERIKNKHNITN